MPKESITLYFREGSSDKVYQAAIEELNGGFVVNFAYGRRGSTFNTGSKTSKPVSFEEAKTIYDKLVKSKTSKGYTPGEDGTPYQHTNKEDRVTGLLPQLCNPVANGESGALLADNAWWMQEKFDGKRILLRKDERGVVGINRKGLIVGLPKVIQQAAETFSQAFIIDGESIDDRLHVFDLLSLEEDVLLARPYSERLVLLRELLDGDNPHLLLVPTAKTTAEKSQLLLNLKAARKEGVVFKQKDAPYTSGRPASGGTWMKHKFTITGSFIVCRLNADKRSVGLEVKDGRRGIEIGNVTIPANKSVPTLGGVIEVRYLYAYKGGSLYQPVFLNVRDDIAPKECTVKQLKYKAENSEEETDG